MAELTSIEQLTSRDTCEIRRESVAAGSGEAIKTWTTGARGALPAVDVKCRIQEQNAKEANECGVRSGVRSWNVYFGFSGDPKITVADRLFFTDDSGTAHECLIKQPSKSDDNQNRLWKTVIEELGFAR